MNAPPAEAPMTQHHRPERRRRPRPGRTREALLDSAQQLLAERGILGASLADIAANADLTKGAVYSNFADKTDLLLALFEDRVRPGIDLGAHGRAAHTFAEHAEAAETLPRSLLFLEFWLYGLRDHVAGWRLAAACHDHRKRLAEQIDKEARPDTAHDLTPMDRATLTMALDLGLTLQYLLDPVRAPAELYDQAIRCV